MNESQKAVLRRYHQKLADDLIVTEDLLGEMFQEGIFPHGIIELIRAERVPPDRVQKLLELLPKRGPDAFDLFVKVLEESYPWLATLLASAPQVKPQPVGATTSTTKADGAGHRHPSVRGQARPSSPGLHGMDFVDGDIKKLVQAFVHKQFGQSKRISEKDKKSVERFVSDQIQRERTRYLSMLSSTPSTPCSDMGSASDNVFQATEIQDHLFSIHMKLEPHVTSIKASSNKSNTTTTTNTTNNNSISNAQCTSCSCDGGDTHEHCIFHNHQLQPKNQKLMPEDMDFQLVAKEVEEVVRHVELLEAKLADGLALFDPRLHNQPIASLIELVMRRCDRLEEELGAERDRVSDLLEECHKYSEHIELLEKERGELRKQITAIYQDMGTLRQQKAELRDKLRQAEKDKAQWQAQLERGRESNFRLGFVSKQAKTTPRTGGANMGGAGLGGVAGSATTDDGGAAGVSHANEGARRPTTRGAGLRTPVAYTGYSRRYQGVVSRYAMSGAKKRVTPATGQRDAQGRNLGTRYKEASGQ
ncbi:CASP2 and RIPK1 domain containing adaptor with death domain [Elysia marginata]|uniref:CASP2 and RIPK1 domain containing adaptor with death domain n=1 Tax=Elysia marginata TaxID=1093978 RepID=A0AAV4FSQ4_9GAST|nr:CASP2 and RIPK1 domain containing adaptor with death domain [Elysia marginata]